MLSVGVSVRPSRLASKGRLVVIHPPIGEAQQACQHVVPRVVQKKRCRFHSSRQTLNPDYPLFAPRSAPQANSREAPAVIINASRGFHRLPQALRVGGGNVWRVMGNTVADDGLEAGRRKRQSMPVLESARLG